MDERVPKNRLPSLRKIGPAPCPLVPSILSEYSRIWNYPWTLPDEWPTKSRRPRSVRRDGLDYRVTALRWADVSNR